MPLEYLHKPTADDHVHSPGARHCSCWHEVIWAECQDLSLSPEVNFPSVHGQCVLLVVLLLCLSVLGFFTHSVCESSPLHLCEQNPRAHAEF